MKSLQGLLITFEGGEGTGKSTQSKLLYDYLKSKTKDVILEHGITEWLNHPYTDTMMLKKKFDFSCLNFAAGYYNYHTKNEYVIIEDVFNALTLGLKVTNILGENKYKYKSKPTNHFNLF